MKQANACISIFGEQITSSEAILMLRLVEAIVPPLGDKRLAYGKEQSDKMEVWTDSNRFN
jgi:hypothetical protein